MISLKRFRKSLAHASRGIRQVAHEEQSFRMQLIAALWVLVAAFWVELASWERILLVLLIAAVLVLEILNSILERIADAVEPRLSPMVRDIKDMMAGAVLITATTALLVGLFIFWPALEAGIEYLRHLIS